MTDSAADQDRSTLISYLQDYSDIRSEAKRVLQESNDTAVQDLAQNLPPSFNEIRDLEEAPISIGLVGQYDAGKSTLIKALTGREDIPVDSDVCTTEVTSYNWNGIRLVDTPGIAAERPEHDAQTEDLIDQVDLLLFVITGGLFDKVTGSYFQDLAYEQGREREILLVVNQMAVSPGTPDVKRPDIENVTEPRSPDFFFTSFIDSEYHIKAEREEDPEREQKYREKAKFKSFIQNLNDFIREREEAGKITTPFLQVRSVMESAQELSSTDHTTERAAIGLLQRRNQLLHQSEERLRRQLKGELRKSKRDIIEYGDEVAESLVPEQTEEEAKAMQDEAERKFRDRCQLLTEKTDELLEEEMQRLNQEMQELQEGTLQKKIEDDVQELPGSSTIQSEEVTSTSSPQPIPDIDDESVWAQRVRKASKATKNIGSMLSKLATGPEASSGGLLSSAGAKGSQAHKAVYRIGKTFGYKFDPWEAVNKAKLAGNVGRILGAAGSVLGVAAQVREDKQEEEIAKRLQESRDEIRSTYRDMAAEVEKQFWDGYEEVKAEVYDAEIEETNSRRAGLLEDRESRTQTEEDAAALIHKINRILDEVQSTSKPAHTG
jgi:small GTP-binding protein